MQTKTIKELAIGEAFKRKESAQTIYTRGRYVRGRKGLWPTAYECNDWGDISRSIFLKGSTIVCVGFDY